MKRFSVIIINFLLLGVPALVCAAEGLEIPGELNKKINLANLSGISLFFAKWYNDNLWVYAIMVTLLMGIVGLAIAVSADLILKKIGMEVNKIEHLE
jgi:ABC-type phosphate/phosphonate transport system permease subunit